MDRKPILILGVGNTIQMDDGIGVHVIEAMKNKPLPPNIELIDGGTLGYDLLGIIEGRKKIIVVDAVKGQQPPGTLYKFSPEDVPTDNNYDSLHQLGIIELKLDCAFVAVPVSIADELVEKLNNTRLKKKKVRVTSI